MSKPESIKIDDVEYVRKDSAPANGDIKIVVLDRGFVYVGRVTLDGDFVVIAGAKNIRKWGTSKGLGELVSGPRANTVRDTVGTIRAPLRAVIHMIEVEQSKWTTS